MAKLNDIIEIILVKFQHIGKPDSTFPLFFENIKSDKGKAKANKSIKVFIC